MKQLILMVCLVLLYSCNKNKNNTCSSDFFSCKVNNDCFAPTSISDAQVTYSEFYNEFSLVATTNSNEKIVITIPFDTMALKPYTFAMGENKARATYQKNANDPATFYFTKNNLGGTFQITTLDTSAKKLKATFSYIVKSDVFGEQKAIEEGSLNLNY